MLDRDLLSELQLTLIEPPDGGDTFPSLIWTRDEVLDAVNAAVRALARGVHFDVVWVDLPVASGTVALPADWLATASLVWRAADGTRTPLGPADGFEADLAVPAWEATPGLPLAYRDLEGVTLTLQLVPVPFLAGTVELLYIRVPPSVIALAPGQSLPVPEEFTSGVKYGALATLLRKVGRLLDPERAHYCDRRMELSRTAAEILLGGWA